jgi:RNA-directed DNA polymerase
MTTQGSRDRGKDWQASKPEGMVSSSAIPNQQSCGGQQPSGLKTNARGRPTPDKPGRERVTEEAREKVERVMERVYDRRRLRLAWHQVEQNAGAAGLDQMTVCNFKQREKELLEVIHRELVAGCYRFKPARRVLIPKPGSTKKRKLGIPVVMDRIVSQSLNLTLAEIFEPGFTASSYGFRRRRNQQQAIGRVRDAIVRGREWAVAIDLKSFFDEIPHGLILKLVRRRIRDERVVTLIARTLKAGVIVDGEIEKTEKGTPQGSPVSPILSNIVLNELDQELERRGHLYCRWADDFVILVKSQRAANRVKESVTAYLEQELGLPVNQEKSQAMKARNIEFLGYQVLAGKVKVGYKAKSRFRDQVRRLTPRNNPYSMYQVIQELNKYLRGWVNYYRVQEFKGIFRELDVFIRNRLRAMQLKKWKRPKKVQRMMIKAGFPVKQAKQTWVKMDSWRSHSRKEVNVVLGLGWFRRAGLVFLDDYTKRNLKLKFDY